MSNFSEAHRFEFQLPATKSWKCRKLIFMRYIGEQKISLHIHGILHLEESRGPGLQVYIHRYLVQEDLDPSQSISRLFRLVKPGGDETYWVNYHSCDCTGWLQNERCKHVECLHLLLEKRLLVIPKTVSEGQTGVKVG